jgi:hypothetical protein
MKRRDLIDALVEDLVPLQPAPSIQRALFGCWVFAWVGVGAAILWTGDLREGALPSLATSPRYAIEWAMAIGASVSAMLAGLEWGVPGRFDRNGLLLWTIALLGGWIGLVGYGVFDPALEPARLGARPYCDLQTMLFAIPPLALALVLLNRRALFSRASSGWLLGLGAAAVPAAWMQLACAYDPLHDLLHHILPVLVVAGLGALLAQGWPRRG